MMAEHYHSEYPLISFSSNHTSFYKRKVKGEVVNSKSNKCMCKCKLIIEKMII